MRIHLKKREQTIVCVYIYTAQPVCVTGWIPVSLSLRYFIYAPQPGKRPRVEPPEYPSRSSFNTDVPDRIWGLSLQRTLGCRRENQIGAWRRSSYFYSISATRTPPGMESLYDVEEKCIEIDVLLALLEAQRSIFIIAPSYQLFIDVTKTTIYFDNPNYFANVATKN